MIYSFVNTRLYFAGNTSGHRRRVFSSSGGLNPASPRSAGFFAPFEYAASLFATLFPSPCRICGSLLTNVSRLPVCGDCRAQLKPQSSIDLCLICGERVSRLAVAQADPQVCGLCQRTRPPYQRAVAYGSYDGTLRELLHLLKYEGVKPAAPVLAGLLASATRQLGLKEATVIPVPLHRQKSRERGFNQSEMIAAAAVRELGRGFVLQTSVLARKRPTVSQTGLTRHQRRANLRGAFEVRHAERIAERDVLLVDDVMTTGTTASECARVLLRAGARQVFVATAARVQKLEVAAEPVAAQRATA